MKPYLAADSKLDLNVLLQGVTDANWKDKKPGIIAAIKPKLAKDADIGDVVKLLDAIEDDGALGTPDDDMLDAVDADPCDEILGMLRGKLSDQDMAAVESKMRAALPKAMDTPPPTPGAPPPPAGAAPAVAAPAPVPAPKPAMDAAAVKVMIDKATADATEAVRKQAREAAEARQVVRPYIGEVAIALDSGEAIYKAALEVLKVNVDGVPPAAYRHILEAQPKPGSDTRQRVVMDAAPGKDFAERFPGLAGLRTI